MYIYYSSNITISFLQSFNIVILQLFETVVFFFSIQPPPPHPPLANSFLTSVKVVYLVVVTFNFKHMRFVQPNVFLNTHAHDTMLLPQGRQLLQIFYFTGFRAPSHQASAVIHMCN